MRKETVLILDKEFHTQWILKTLLEAEEYIVVAASTIDRIWRNFSEFEVSGFITEYWIGDDSNCLETIRELKGRFPELYVMMLTDADVRDKEYEEIMHAGVDDIFLKPLSGKRILLHLKKGLKQRSTFLERNRFEQELKRIIGRKELENRSTQLINRSVVNET